MASDAAMNVSGLDFSAPPVVGGGESIPPLEAGDNLDQPTFHERYLAMPPDFRAELIEGVVFVPSPVRVSHGRWHFLVATWLGRYEAATPGIGGMADGTVILGPDSEPQPDVALFIEPSHRGQARLEGEYLAGAPELVVEVASTTAAIDLHGKLRDYQKAGVQEYVVILLRSREVRWFVRRDAKLEALPAPEDGVYRSTVFPGLWLDVAAMVERRSAALLATLDQGLKSPEHAEFVRRLEQAGGSTPQP